MGETFGIDLFYFVEYRWIYQWLVKQALENICPMSLGKSFIIQGRDGDN